MSFCPPRLPTNLAGLALLLVMGVAHATTIQGVVLDAQNAPVPNAAVWVMDTAAWPKTRVLTDALGAFRLNVPSAVGVLRKPVRSFEGFRMEQAGKVSVVVRSLDGKVRTRQELFAGAGSWRLANPAGLFQNLPHGTWIVDGLAGSTHWSEVWVGWGGSKGSPRLEPVADFPVAARVLDLSSVQILVRKAGFEALRLDLPNADTNLNLTLENGRYERRIDSLMDLMSNADKFGQMTQGLISSPIGTNRLGSVLSGGGEAVGDYNQLQTQAKSMPRRIPILYGIDAVHGHAKWTGATVLPHNIGLGATRDTGLLRRLGENTAKEMWAGNADWAFAPCIAVARDERWGRTYESYGEVPELAARLGSAYVKGLQGDGFSTPWRVVACSKHYLADGGTTMGTGTGLGKILNEGDAQITQAALDSIHLPGYIAAVAVGVNSIMASYSSFNGAKMHGDKALLTDTLKTDLAFDGFVISDWEAIERMGAQPFIDKVAAAVNAGTDMAMEPANFAEFITDLGTLVGNGKILQSRIDDAVRRILRVKFRQGLFESSARRTLWDAELGSVPHRAIAREAVQKSLVVLKNEASLLPLPKTGKSIAVTGTHADNTGLQCGGWTKVGGKDDGAWNGGPGVVTGATSILSGMNQLVKGLKTTSAGADIVVVVTGEQPYAETNGDATNLPLPTDAATALATAKKAGQKTVLVVVSGRPLILGDALANADAVVAAWLPGSEGQGVGDVLFGDVKPTGKLPCSWPSSMAQIPINLGDANYAPLFPYGYGLSW